MKSISIRSLLLLIIIVAPGQTLWANRVASATTLPTIVSAVPTRNIIANISSWSKSSDHAIIRNIDRFQFSTRIFLTILILLTVYIITHYTLDHSASKLQSLWVLGESFKTQTLTCMAINHPSSIFLTNTLVASAEESPIQVNESRQTPSEKYAKSGLSEHQIDEYYKRLLDCIQKDAPHLNFDLNLSDLADLVGISNHNLSQVINQRAKQTFYDFINMHRVEYAKKLFMDPEHDNNFNIIEIAFKAGFNSKASFNRVFKKHTGRTPSNFRNEAREQRAIQLAS